MIPFFLKNSKILEFPPFYIDKIYFLFQESKVKDLTKENVGPKPLCFDEQSKHIKTPKGTDAHLVFFFSQSIHL